MYLWWWANSDLRVPILSFPHTNVSKRRHVWSWHLPPLRGWRPQWEILDPPLNMDFCGKIGSNPMRWGGPTFSTFLYCSWRFYWFVDNLVFSKWRLPTCQGCMWRLNDESVNAYFLIFMTKIFHILMYKSIHNREFSRSIHDVLWNSDQLPHCVRPLWEGATFPPDHLARKHTGFALKWRLFWLWYRSANLIWCSALLVAKCLLCCHINENSSMRGRNNVVGHIPLTFFCVQQLHRHDGTYACLFTSWGVLWLGGFLTCSGLW